jgi:hypothetical protein
LDPDIQAISATRGMNGRSQYAHAPALEGSPVASRMCYQWDWPIRRVGSSTGKNVVCEMFVTSGVNMSAVVKPASLGAIKATDDHEAAVCALLVERGRL